MIKVERPSETPRSLAAQYSTKGQLVEAIKVFTETTAAAEQSSATGLRTKPFVFKNYNGDDVKYRLNELFQRKCAYCESFYEATSLMEIEHFRPKAIVQQDRQDRRALTGYYWLAWDWNNLLPSCHNCNCVIYHFTTSYPVEEVLRGKGNLFPLTDDTKRALSHEISLADEEQLLLDPCKDNPEEHLEFTEDGVIHPKQQHDGTLSPKGVTSIESYGLDRIGLTRERERIAYEIKVQIGRVKRALARVIKYPADRDFEVEYKEELVVLLDYMKPNREFSAMAKQLIGRFRIELGLENKP